MADNEYLKDLMQKAGYASGSEPVLRILRYFELLEKWNRQINLTSSVQSGAIRILFHEAIWAARFYPVGDSYHLDIGSGAGFPALILRALKERMRLDLVESRSKKAVFLETVVQDLGMTSVNVFNGRLRDYFQNRNANMWDCISWKAVKVSHEEMSFLAERSKAETRFWLFHGTQLPLEKPEDAVRWLHLLNRKEFPGKKGWHLSIYKPACSCFT